MTERKDGPGSWKIRRRFMFAVSIFCVLVISYVLWKQLSGSVADTAITMSFVTLMSTVGSYVFGATWQDISKKD